MPTSASARVPSACCRFIKACDCSCCAVILRGGTNIRCAVWPFGGRKGTQHTRARARARAHARTHTIRWRQQHMFASWANALLHLVRQLVSSALCVQQSRGQFVDTVVDGSSRLRLRQPIKLLLHGPVCTQQHCSSGALAQACMRGHYARRSRTTPLAAISHTDLARVQIKAS